MKKRQQAIAEQTCRPVRRFWLWTAKYRRAILAGGLSLVLLASGTLGYQFGQQQLHQSRNRGWYCRSHDNFAQAYARGAICFLFDNLHHHLILHIRHLLVKLLLLVHRCC